MKNAWGQEVSIGAMVATITSRSSRVGIVVDIQPFGDEWKARWLWLDDWSMDAEWVAESTVFVHKLIPVDESTVDQRWIEVLADAYADWFLEHEPCTFVPE
ncbi:hypothetical protein R2325_16545 [Mycobacteroides chelonae]|jgi:hypothetical protein|uniref:hypothetical protein n=1 Tax=Mycobacteroides TaxID=670516 RepID=UPI00092A4F4C|nr:MULTISPECIES: hypothetical protein [Mycobacteroides]MBV6360462.1 hypothetical protein [Mycobacteroides chelonae]MEC4857185.1 hypothetical protein [Mycobacteroides chelonae]MEC4873594.1 hypothetical protein [Mycobacteroides chelonae]SHW94101.1 Uncharacterised protein [Mycobacteroides abscessus subsp. abscessus]SKL80033.1 Uncharacterised protein [Mycobacteroides abscessus subsp. abscessus]